MDKAQRMKLAIQEVVRDLMERVMSRVLETDPFMPDEHKAKKPLYAALVPDEIFKGSHFERRFVTPFGGVWEKLAVVAANNGLGCGIQNQTIKGSVKRERLRRITEILNNLEHGRKNGSKIKPNWNEELEYILKGGGEDIPVTVICDVYAENAEKTKKYAFEIKAPLPNSDQTKVSKEKILKLYSMAPCPIDGAFYALPYNLQLLKRGDYNWSFPARWFDMKKDEVVLIGKEFWEKIGGVGTYDSFISAINEIGEGYKSRIYKEFLGIDPPGKFKKTLE